MHKHRHTEKLNFSGYGGFNFSSDFFYMTKACWTYPDGMGYENGWCDTGYQNVAAAADASTLGWIYKYGVMEASTGHSFTMESFLATASWSRDMPWDIISYTDCNGVLKEKASDQITVTFSKVETIDLNKIGHRGAFTNIAAVAFEMVNSGQYGNTCTYGTGEKGVQMCLDDIKVKFSKNADLKLDDGRLRTPYLMHHHHHHHHQQQQHALHIAAQCRYDPQGAPASGEHALHAPHMQTQYYHSQILSLGHNTGLTDQFALPRPEHFGT